MESVSELDSDIWQEFLDQTFKITMINMLRTLKEKAGNMKEQVRNVSREMKTLKKK